MEEQKPSFFSWLGSGREGTGRGLLFAASCSTHTAVQWLTCKVQVGSLVIMHCVTDQQQ